MPREARDPVRIRHRGRHANGGRHPRSELRARVTDDLRICLGEFVDVALLTARCRCRPGMSENL
jgi:hypothetical protein